MVSDFIKLSVENIPILIRGLPVTIMLSLLGVVLALLVGIVGGVLGNSSFRTLRAIAKVYVYIFRNVPFLIFLYLVFYGLPYADIHLAALPTAIIALVINHGAYMSEIIRGGLSSIKKEQKEAAISLGLTYSQRMRKVILPQVLMQIAGSTAGQTSLLIKDTSIVSVIGLSELTRLGREIVVRTYTPFSIFLFVAIFYFILCYSMQKLSDWSEKKVRRYTMGTA